MTPYYTCHFFRFWVSTPIDFLDIGTMSLILDSDWRWLILIADADDDDDADADPLQWHRELHMSERTIVIALIPQPRKAWTHIWVDLTLLHDLLTLSLLWETLGCGEDRSTLWDPLLTTCWCYIEIKYDFLRFKERCVHWTQSHQVPGQSAQFRPNYALWCDDSHLWSQLGVAICLGLCPLAMQRCKMQFRYHRCKVGPSQIYLS